MRQQRGKALMRCRMAVETLAMMLDSARSIDDALRAQRCAAVHGDGRDGGRGPHRGGGRPRRSTWRSASRRRRAVDRRSRRRRPRSAGRARLHRSRSAFLRCGRASRGTMPRPIACRSSADRVIVTTGSSAGFILAFLAMFEPGDRVAIANPGYPPYRHILTALGCEPVLIETDGSDALCDHRRKPARRAREEAAHRRAGRKPGQSDRHHDDARRACRADRVADEEGIRFISDEIYHGLDYALPAETAARLSENARRHQLVLEILLHDRLAHRLDGGAGGRWCGRSTGCRAISRSRCRRCRRSRRRRRSTAAPRSRRSSTATRTTGKS